MVRTAIGQLVCALAQNVATGDRVSIVFRPEDVRIQTDSQGQRTNTFSGVVERIIFVGNKTLCEILVGNVVVHSEISSHADLQRGKGVTVQIPPEHIRVLRVG